MKICITENCDNKAICKGLCRSCYGRDYNIRNKEQNSIRNAEYHALNYEKRKLDKLEKRRIKYKNDEEHRTRLTTLNREKYQRDREKILAQKKQQYFENIDVHKARQKAYRDSHKEEIALKQSKYYQDNRERLLSQNKEYLKNRPELRKVIWNNRRARELENGGSFTETEWLALLETYHYSCPCCLRGDVELTVDHIVPVSKGGTSNIDNIQPLCHSCNSSKKTKTIKFEIPDLSEIEYEDIPT